MTDPSWQEADRLAALERAAILDTAPEPVFDDAVALVRTVCRVPIAMVSLVDTDRQWFKARAGVDLSQTDLGTSVCALAIRQDGPFVIPDLTADPRTADMTLVTGEIGARFYAGVPLVTADGLPLGSLCAVDTVPRPGGLTDEQVMALTAIARQVIAQIELRSAIDSQDRATAMQDRRQDQASRDTALLQAMLKAQHRVLRAGGAFEASLVAVVEAALEVVQPADGVVVELCDGVDLVHRAASGTSAGRLGARMPIAGSLSGYAVTTPTTLIVADVLDDPRGQAEATLSPDMRSLVIVPLSRHGEVFGTLKLHAAEPGVFRSRHVLIAQMLGGLIAASFTEIAEVAALRSVEHAEQHHRHVVDSAIDSAIIATDDAGIVTSWSRGGETIFGWTEEEMIGQPLARIFTPEDRAAGRVETEMALARADGRAADERWHMRKDGGRFFAHGALTPLIGADGGFVKSLRDVTNEHRTRTALETSRLRLDVALETGLIAFFSWDVAADTVTGDTRLSEFFGLDRDAVTQGVPLATMLSAVVAAQRKSVAARMECVAGTAGDYSMTFRVAGTGGTRLLLARARCIEQIGDRPICYVGTIVDVTMQHEAEDRLRVSQERLELATRAAGLGSFDFLPQTGVLDWDDRCRALFGVPADAPISYEGTFLAALHPDDRGMVDDAVAAALDPAAYDGFAVEYRITASDGVERVLAANGLTVFEDAVAVRFIGTVQDVTADRRARTVLRETEERLRLAAHATNDAIWDWDLRADHVLWNDALTGAYGHRLADVDPVGAWWLDHIHPEDRERIDRSLHAVIDGTGTDWTDEYRFARADGSYAEIRDRGYVIRDERGKAIRMLGAMLDQTERKRIEHELTELNQMLEARVGEGTEELDRLWRTSPDLLVVVERGGIVQRANPAWTTILGYEASELIGRKIEQFVHPDDHAQMAAAVATSTLGALPVIENRYFHADGSLRWFSWAGARTETEIYATGRHITEAKEAADALKRAEDQLRQAQKVEAVGQLTGGVAHDFNNLLTVIRGSVELLRRPDLSEDRRRRYIDAIADTAERATKLTSQLLAFARRSALTPEVFDVGAGIRALGDMVGTLAGSAIAIHIDLPETPCFIDADPSQFDTAIVNMAVNARDAMDRQGILTISVAAVDVMPGVRSHPPVDGAFVAVSIADTGEGIPDAQIDQIFEPFFTTKGVGEGTGLGLSQVFGFAKQSGGEIQVTSREGEGATFTLYLPRAEGLGLAPARTAATSMIGLVKGRGAYVLVVEDNPDVGMFATHALAELGYRTILADDATQALALLAQGADAYDVVFSDVMMPGITGIEMGLEIRRSYPGLPVILTSGYSEVLAQEGPHGFDLLHKPYSVEALSRMLRKVVRPGRRD